MLLTFSFGPGTASFHSFKQLTRLNGFHSVEVNLVILCACFPSLPALYRFLTDKTYRMSLRPSKHKEIFSSMSSGGSNAAPASDTGGGDNGTESNFLKYQIYRTVDIETHWSAV